MVGIEMVKVTMFSVDKVVYNENDSGRKSDG